MTTQRVTLPSFAGEKVTASDMRQFISALEIRLQQLEVRVLQQQDEIDSLTSELASHSH